MEALTWVAGILIILIGGFFALNSYIYHEKQGEPGQIETELYVATPLLGETVGMTFTVTGEVPQAWLENGRFFSVEMRGEDGTFLGDYGFFVDPALLSNGRYSFTEILSTGGIDGAGVYDGPAHLTFVGVEESQRFVLPIVIRR